MSHTYKAEEIIHDKTKKVDLTQNTVAAYQRAKWAVNSALDIAIDELHSQGMPKDDPLLIWQLVGVVLRRRQEELELAAFGGRAPEKVPLPGVAEQDDDEDSEEEGDEEETE